MTPLQVLATSMAYMIRADHRITVEERAKLVTLMGKHITLGHITDTEIQSLTQDALDRVMTVPIDEFLEEVTGKLSRAQRQAIVINLYDTMLVDGRVVDGEVKILERFERAFGLEYETMRAVRDVVMLKNDTTLFTNPVHPRNESDYVLKIARQK